MVMRGRSEKAVMVTITRGLRGFCALYIMKLVHEAVTVTITRGLRGAIRMWVLWQVWWVSWLVLRDIYRIFSHFATFVTMRANTPKPSGQCTGALYAVMLVQLRVFEHH